MIETRFDRKMEVMFGMSIGELWSKLDGCYKDEYYTKKAELKRYYPACMTHTIKTRINRIEFCRFVERNKDMILMELL